ncbi:EAL domain-containing protein [Thalassotalea psychrophila]|uniref:EAL domain-containing protein n=1 Tax=Thalassotalea psychrophila TaxID=3065647 RepID=A0ABY9TR38_9GAMM|nr:EAL domain-containing protein [Colwelliaceae bacterium SQ149]
MQIYQLGIICYQNNKSQFKDKAIRKRPCVQFKNNNKISYKVINLFQMIMVTLLAIFSVSAHSSSQTPIKFQQLSIEQGLSQSSVYSIAQDKEGFIWLATGDGLNRYDGYEFSYYRNELNNPNSLLNNLVRVVFVDSSNTLWVGTQAGLSKYNPALDEFDNSYTNFKDKAIWSIFEDKDNNLFVSTADGLYTLKDNALRFSKINFREFSNDIKEIKSIFQDVNDRYWIGTFENGLYISNKELDFISPINGKNKWHLNIDSGGVFEIQKIEGNYWVATDNGIFIVDETYQLKKHILAEQYGSNPLANKTRSLNKVNNFEVLIGTEHGLYSYNLIEDSFTRKRIAKVDSSPLEMNFIYSMFTDASDTVWVGTSSNGINKFNSIYSLFPHYLSNDSKNKKNVLGFAELPNGNIWIYTQFNGLYYIDKLTNQVIKSPVNIKDSIKTIFPDTNNNLWLITKESNILYFDTTLNTLIKYDSLEHLASSRNDKIDFLAINDEIWFGSNNSVINRYSLINKKLTTYRISDEKETIYTISINKNDEIWLNGSSGNIYKFNIILENFKKIALPLNKLLIENNITYLKEDTNYIWFGFWDQGILLFDKQHKTYQLFNENSGLANNFIANLLLDDSGDAWISTNKGISKISPRTLSISNYDSTYGLQSNEFWDASSLKTSNGKLLFGGINGFNSFYPDEIEIDSQIIFKPILSKLRIANKEVKIVNKDKQSTIYKLNAQLSHLREITLDYAQSPFTLEFISPNPNIPEQVLYRYKLIGLDDNWIETNHKNKRATYTNLNSGSYSFALEAFDLTKNKYISSKNFTIHILPPWWKTNIAWAVYVLCSLFIIYYFIRQAQNKELSNIKIKESEERLKLALWGSGDEMWDWNLKTNQMFRSNIWGILDFPIEGSEISADGEERRNIHPQDYPRVKQLLLEHKEGKSEHYEAAYRVKDKTNSWLWVLDRGKIVERDENDAPLRMTGTLKDISQIKANEESLKLFAKCIENISDAVVVYDNQFKLVDCNISYQTITGQSRAEALGQMLAFNSYPDSFLQNLKKNLLSHGTWQGEIESKRSTGDSYLVDITIDIIHDENDNISHFVGVFSDITKRKETEAELRKLANSDTLTGLPNRSFFQANHSQLVSQDLEHALLVFDLDNFKKINDSLGHQVGDVLLCKVTERIATIGNIKDTCYRLGGDEFALILEGTNDIHKITSIADEVLNTIVEPYYIRQQEISLSCSIGIVLFPDDGANSHELLKNADTAMYHAKDKGGDTYQFFNDSMNKQAVKRLQIENLIRHGLKEDLFSVFYQPKIDVATGAVKGMEALVRFEAGNKGIIRPDIFIPISEETGQILEIGEIVLRKACLATKAWLDNGMFRGRIAVNLSAVQFRQPNLVQIIAEILEETKLPAKHLELEITEGTVMNSPQEAIELMHQIRKMGVNLSLDDFGTGYSSLAYLKQFPLNTLKIDKAFVDDIEASEEGRNMVATIVTIAHNLGMDVVAEGVETESQLKYLKTVNCEQMQGYLYSKPLAEEDFGRYLLSHIITNKSTPYNNI